MTTSAIILCAGKGTRMNDDSCNKVAFDCAGKPVIRRIVENMKLGGVSRFVIVVGHKAQSVMDSLDGIDGIVYAYQKEQKGTGHAAMCGLKALLATSDTGSVIISMGDKIIAPEVIHDILQASASAKAVWGVQPLEANPSGGRIVMYDGKPCGIVELADAALMAIANVPEASRRDKLLSLGLNEKKIAKVLKTAASMPVSSTRQICGRTFTANDVLRTKYANAGLYCFDMKSVMDALMECTGDNAQGEIYLTDTLEYYAARGEAKIYEIPNRESMLTYSTKPELRAISRYFLRSATEFIAAIQRGEFEAEFERLYRENTSAQKERYVQLLKAFVQRYGDEKVIITRSPGRVNLMGKHIDHRGGGINVMATANDTVMVCAPRDDDTVRAANLDAAFAENAFTISGQLGLAEHEDWLAYLSHENVVAELEKTRGDWVNYIKSAVLRFAIAANMEVRGMDMMVCGNIPVAAGLSSSSSIVVATAEAVTVLNSLNLSKQEFVDLCGEGEWFVGSRGGAGDHAAMKCCEAGKITHLSFKPFQIGNAVYFSNKYAVIVADSTIKAKKSEGSKDIFNAKVAAYEIAFMYLKREFPEWNMQEFRDLAKVPRAADVYKMLKRLPEKITRSEAFALLPEYEARLQRIFMSHVDPGEYALRGVTLYGVSECARADKCLEALENDDYHLLGDMMKISHDGDRVCDLCITDELLDKLYAEDAPLVLQSGTYGCSTERIDYLCDLLNGTDGVLGSQIVGAGLGGCVVALVEKEKAGAVIDRMNEAYYDKFGYKRSAHVYMPSSGSAVLI